MEVEWTAPPGVDLALIDQKAREFRSGRGGFIHETFFELKLDEWYSTTKTIATQCLIERETLQGSPLVAAMVFLGVGLFRKRKPKWINRSTVLSLLEEDQMSLWFLAYLTCLKNFSGRYSASRSRPVMFHEYFTTTLPINFGIMLRRNIIREETLARIPVIGITDEVPKTNKPAWNYQDLAAQLGLSIQAIKKMFGPGTVLRNKVKYAKIYGIHYLAADLD